VNCAAIVETLLEAELFGIKDRTATGVRGRRGKFEHAHDGTLFLDEVSDLSPADQAKLLRAIQDLSVERVGGVGSRQVDTRIIVATNRPLSTLVEGRQFRLDLYCRLNEVDIQGGRCVDVGRTSPSRRATFSSGIRRWPRLLLERCENNKRRACRELGFSNHTVGGGGLGPHREPRDPVENPTLGLRFWRAMPPTTATGRWRERVR
jgi:transcriptional regulator with AAA-type ATPase domain